MLILNVSVVTGAGVSSVIVVDWDPNDKFDEAVNHLRRFGIFDPDTDRWYTPRAIQWILVQQVVVPPELALILTPYAPTVDADTVQIPDTLALALTPYAPTVDAPAVQIPDALALALTPFEPDVLIA